VVVGELLGYARVSTTVQDPALQHDALRAAGAGGCGPTPPRDPGRTARSCSK